MSMLPLVVGLSFFFACSVATDPGTCSFDTGLCGYTQDSNDRFDWSRNNGSTPSWETGPDKDQSGTGFYMYIETSWPRLNKEAAVLVSPVLDNTKNCVEFYYHMKGLNIRTLNVYTQESSGSRTLRWFLTGDQSSTSWSRGSIRLPSKRQNLKVAFEGIVGTGYMADIAIDSIRVYHDPICVTHPAKAAPQINATPKPDANLPTVPTCGHKPGSRIVGGQDAQQGEWPWQAMLMYNRNMDFPDQPIVWRQFCGGTLVTENWVVTASHCVSGISPSQYVHYRIRMGGHEISNTNANVQDFDIERIYVHHDYNAYPYEMDNDIALIKLKKPAMLKTGVALACIPNNAAMFPAGTNCYITGWGTLKSGGDAPVILQEAKVPLVSKAECTKNGSYPVSEISPTMLCAGYPGKGGVDTCQGDSGGPLVCENSGKWYLVGVTSWGYSCADPKYPGIYANVPVLHQWLANTIKYHV